MAAARKKKSWFNGGKEHYKGNRSPVYSAVAAGAGIVALVVWSFSESGGGEKNTWPTHNPNAVQQGNEYYNAYTGCAVLRPQITENKNGVATINMRLDVFRNKDAEAAKTKTGTPAVKYGERPIIKYGEQDASGTLTAFDPGDDTGPNATLTLPAAYGDHRYDVFMTATDATNSVGVMNYCGSVSLHAQNQGKEVLVEPSRNDAILGKEQFAPKR
jgi:hypothetical protein